MTNPTRVTIIPSDTFCSVNGVAFSGIDMSSVRSSVHAVQWYGAWGEEEIIDKNTLRMQPSIRITSLSNYSKVLTAYQELADAANRAAQEEAALNTIIEV